ncbi:MAG TPA: UvrB/UvrC motif-containing protein, partial [Rhodothermales bacterium]|nr:UvrB/UvrC motif-containing protein [Rhodothermales bacterium]
ESRLIKEHKPRFNRALRRYRNRPFIRLDVMHDIPRITLSSYLLDDGAEYFGPMSGRRHAELVVDVINQFFLLRECDDDTFRLGRRCLYGGIGRCTAPCVDEEAALTYDAEVERVRAFLTGQDRSVLDEIEARMKAAAAEMDFEQAAEYRDWLRRLGRMSAKQEAIAAPVLEHNAVLVLPGVLPETRQGYLVRFGRHVDTVTLSEPPTPEEVAQLRERLAVHFDPDQPRPERYFKKEVEEIRLLAHWLYVHRDSALSVHWNVEKPLDAFLEAILAAAQEPLLKEALES